MSGTRGKSSEHCSDRLRERMSSSLPNLEAQPSEDLVQEPEVAEEGAWPLAEELPGAADERDAQRSCRSQDWAACCRSSRSHPPREGSRLPDQTEAHLYWERLPRSQKGCSWRRPPAVQEEKEMRGKMQDSVLWQ